MTAENNITLLPMLPSEYQNGGKNLMIRYNYTQSLFGEMLLTCSSFNAFSWSSSNAA